MSVQTHGYIGFTGLSTDTKPNTGVVIGSTFFETDSYKTWTWKYDTVSSTWTWVDDQEDIEELMLSITYSSLSTLASAGRLIAGRKYRITDYSSIYQQPYTDIVSISPDGITASLDASIEELVVMAESTTTFFREAISLLFPNDTIYYSFTSQVLTYDTVDYNTKGGITYRKDNILGVEFDYDFRCVKIRLYKMNIAAFDGGVTYDYTDMFKQGGSVFVQISGASNRGCNLLDNTISFNSGDQYLLLEDKAYGAISISRDTSDYVDVLSLYNTITPSDISVFTNISARGGYNVIYGSASSPTDNIKLYGGGNVFFNGNIPLKSYPLRNVYIDNINDSILYGCYNVTLKGSISNLYTNTLNFTNITFGENSNTFLPSTIIDTSIGHFEPSSNGATFLNISQSTITSFTGVDCVASITQCNIPVFQLGSVNVYIYRSNVSILSCTLPYNCSILNSQGIYSNVTFTPQSYTLDGIQGSIISSTVSKQITNTTFKSIDTTTLLTKVSFTSCMVTSPIDSSTVVPSADTDVSDTSVYKQSNTLYYDKMLSSGVTQLTYIN